MDRVLTGVAYTVFTTPNHLSALDAFDGFGVHMPEERSGRNLVVSARGAPTLQKRVEDLKDSFAIFGRKTNFFR